MNATSCLMEVSYETNGSSHKASNSLNKNPSNAVCFIVKLGGEREVE